MVGYTHCSLGEEATAIVMLRGALAIKNADHITRCNVSRVLGRALHNCRNLVDAEAQCHATIKRLEEANDAGVLLTSSREHSVIRAKVLSTFGSIYLDTNRPFEALRSLEEALQLFESIGDSAEAAEVLGCISSAYLKQGLYDKSLGAAQRSKSIDGGTTRSFGGLGDALCYLFCFEEALATYRKALACAPREARRSAEVAHIHMNIGTTLHSLGRKEEALISLCRSCEILEELQQTNSPMFANYYF